MNKKFGRLLGLAAIVALLGACSANADTAVPAGASPGAGAVAKEVRLGYFPNLTHAPAIVGVDQGYFAAELGDTALKPMLFNAGPAAIEALFSGAVDMAFVGPNPTINGFVKSKGAALRVVAGAASGGAGLVVRSGISSAEQLKGAKLATPQLGNTQDVALRHWLKSQGLATTVEGGGDVSIMPQDNATALQAFSAGQIDGAWLPEPWMTRLIEQGGAHVLVNEADLWPDKQFVVTNLVVRKEFLDKYPGTVAAVLKGELNAIDFINAKPEQAQTVVNAGIEKLTGQPLQKGVLATAWANVKFTPDPLASTLLQGAKNAQSVGLLDSVDLDGIYDTRILNSLLAARGQSEVAVP